VLVRRDNREKSFTPLAGVGAKVRETLDALQHDLLERARKFMADNTTPVGSYDEFKQVMASKRGFLLAGWCRDADCEAKIKEETKATTRVIPLDREPVAGTCVRCGKPSASEVLFAQAY
jgi:prolyl-tRNA synthetase